MQVIWDYLCLDDPLQKADCIVGFGNFNTDIARRAAELYHGGFAPKILFTGGLGRNTEGLLPEPEAVRFARVARECGVPDEDIIFKGAGAQIKSYYEKNGIVGFNQHFSKEMEEAIPNSISLYSFITGNNQLQLSNPEVFGSFYFS